VRFGFGRHAEEGDRLRKTEEKRREGERNEKGANEHGKHHHETHVNVHTECGWGY
jgi:hypothetical protein